MPWMHICIFRGVLLHKSHKLWAVRSLSLSFSLALSLFIFLFVSNFQLNITTQTRTHKNPLFRTIFSCLFTSHTEARCIDAFIQKIIIYTFIFLCSSIVFGCRFRSDFPPHHNWIDVCTYKKYSKHLRCDPNYNLSKLVAQSERFGNFGL